MTSPVVTKQALRPCPICGQGRVEVLHTQRFALADGSPLPTASDVVACPACGLVYADTAVSQLDYDRHYASFSKYEDPAATGGGGSARDRERLERLAEKLAERVPPDARILDLGCAAGGLLLALRERGLGRLHGVDASLACVERVRGAGIAATCLPLSNLGAFGSGASFDLIVLSHVLEHVVELLPLLDAVRSLLAPGGIVYAETPDASRYLEHPFVPFYFFDPEHINHFDPVRLSALGRASGLPGVEAGTGTLDVAARKTYPVCWALLRHGSSSGEPEAGNASRSLRDRVAAYVDACRTAPRYPVLAGLGTSRRPVVVWGAGSFAQRLFGDGAFEGCRVVAVVDRDRNKQGRLLAGFSVEAPEAALARCPDAIIVVAVAVADAAVVDEARSLRPGGDVLTLASGSAAALAGSDS